MAQWSANGSNNAGTPTWGHALVNKAANSTIRATLHNNVSHNTFVNNQVVSIVSVDATEIGIHKEVAHTGHHKRTVGTGGRAGRVHYECLVAGGIVGDINADDQFLPDTAPAIVIDLQPLAGDISDGTARAFVAAHAVPRTLAITSYTWQGNNASVQTTITANATNGANTPTLNLAQAGANATYTCLIQASGAANVTTTGIAVTA